MRNVNFKFYVTTNSNTYYATSLKAIQNFCKKHDFVISQYFSYVPLECEKKDAVKCGRGIYCITSINYTFYHVK